MNDQNPYAAPQTTLGTPAVLPIAEESTAFARNYSNFCWAVGFLLGIWCLVPVGVVIAANLRNEDANALLVLLDYGFFLASWWTLTIPHQGWILRWLQISVGLQAITAVLLSILLFGELLSPWLTAGVLLILASSLIALLAGINRLGQELFSPSLTKPASFAIGSLGLAILFCLAAMTADFFPERRATYALVVLMSFSLVVSYVAILITLSFAWRMPQIISERMQRCFPTRIVPANTPANQFLQDLQQQDAEPNAPAADRV